MLTLFIYLDVLIYERLKGEENEKAKPNPQTLFYHKTEVGNWTDKAFPTQPVLDTGFWRMLIKLRRAVQRGDRSDGGCS